MKNYDFSEMVDVMSAIYEHLETLERGGFSKAQIDRLKQCFSGKKRQFEALQAALWTHYCHKEKLDLDALSQEKKLQLNHFGDGRPSLTREQWINENLTNHARKIQGLIFAAISSNNMAFLRDYAYFIENPIRNYSKLKLWLIEICWCGDGDGYASFGTATAPLGTEEFAKFPAGFQRKIFSGDELAELYQKTRGESIETSLIYRNCRELGIKTKHPKKSRRIKK